MRRLLIVVAVLVAIVAVVFVGGMLLPQNHVAARSASYRAPPEQLWALITDVAAYPGWRSDVKTVTLLPDRDGRRVWRESGGSGDITFATVESSRPSRLVTRIEGNSDFGGTWTYVLTPADGGGRLTIVERGEVYNPIFRFLSRFVFGHTSTIDDYLRAVGRKLGEEVEPASAEIPAG